MKWPESKEKINFGVGWFRPRPRDSLVKKILGTPLQLRKISCWLLFVEVLPKDCRQLFAGIKVGTVP